MFIIFKKSQSKKKQKQIQSVIMAKQSYWEKIILKKIVIKLIIVLVEFSVLLLKIKKKAILFQTYLEN